MKDALRTRLEFLWAKLAGRDVDIDTLTPDAPTNMVEKLMLETADRIAGASGGGGGVITIDYDSLAQTERIVDFISDGEVQENMHVFLYDIDLDSQYRLLRHVSPSEMVFTSTIQMSVGTASECPDTESETFELAETISGETTVYAIMDPGGEPVYIVPTTTQFKTYKKAITQ